MIDILILLLINSAACLGFWNACLYESKNILVWNDKLSRLEPKKEYDKGFFWRLEKWGNGKFWYKPIGGCLPCMASLHSILPYWGYMYSTGCLNEHALLFYPVYVLALSGINTIIEDL